jgi:hypothetical protein
MSSFRSWRFSTPARCAAARPARERFESAATAQAKTTESARRRCRRQGEQASSEGDAPLIPDWATRSYRITTSSKLAQRYFDQGLRVAWGFNHAEAQRAFQKAQQLDPKCAMCYGAKA